MSPTALGITIAPSMEATAIAITTTMEIAISMQSTLSL